MKKLILSTLALTLLCGCASLDSNYSEPSYQEITSACETTDVTSAAPESTSAPADSNIWLDRGVYEVQEIEEADSSLAYDNRFKGEYYVFHDGGHGDYWSVYDGKEASFNCEQAKDSIAFHETNIWQSGNNSLGSKLEFTYSKDSDHSFELNEDGNVVFRSYDMFMFALVKRPDLDPDTFDATELKSSYVLSDHGWLEDGSYAYKGKKLEETAQ